MILPYSRGSVPECGPEVLGVVKAQCGTAGAGSDIAESKNEGQASIEETTNASANSASVTCFFKSVIMYIEEMNHGETE